MDGSSVFSRAGLLRLGLLRLTGALEWINRSVGAGISWLALAMVLVTFLVVVLRYAFDFGSIALQESVTYMHGGLFMLGAAYTLQQDGHVRVDIFYQGFSRRRRAWVDLLGTLLLLVPVCVFLIHTAWSYVAESWAVLEGSREAGGIPGVWLLKTLIVVMPVLVLVQGLVWLLRNGLFLSGVEAALPETPSHGSVSDSKPMPMAELMPLLLFLAVGGVLLLGYPVALSLGGTALLLAFFGEWLGFFDHAFIEALPNRVYGVMTNETLIAVPLFVFMGVMLERSRVAENLLDTMALLFGPMRGGLGISVTVVGMLLAASTGIVGATVVTMGLLSLPTMLKRNYAPSVAAGTICASGTLGQIIPPSIVLVLLGDVLSAAYQQAQLDMGIFSPDTVSVGDLFVGALIPGLLLVAGYVLYMVGLAVVRPESVPAIPAAERPRHDVHFWLRVLRVLLPPLVLIVAVLGSILYGFATPTEAASVGAVGALLLAALQRQLSVETLRDVVRQTTIVTSMVFFIFIGAAIFSLVFRGFEGDEMVTDFLTGLPGGTVGAVALVMLVMFLLGFILDFIEITFVVVPIVGPVLLAMGLDPVWLGVMIAINLQTSFLTPPFGFALFYLRGVAAAEVQTMQIYRGVIPFILIQLLMLGALALFPGLATWLPHAVYR